MRRKRQLLKDSAPSSLVGGQTNGVVQPRPIEFLPCHNLTSTRIVEQLSNSQNLAEMLADYRAKGGRIRQRETSDPFNSATAAASSQSRGADIPGKPSVKSEGEEERPSKQSEMNWAPKVSNVRPIILHQNRISNLTLPSTVRHYFFSLHIFITSEKLWMLV